MKLFFYLNAVLVFLCGCRDKKLTNNNQRNVILNTSNCGEFSKHEEDILHFLKNRNLSEINEMFISRIYSEYYNNYFIDSTRDTVYLAYLDIRPHYLTFRSLDSTSFEIGYNIVDSNCKYLDTAFQNADFLILDFGMTQGKGLDYVRDRKGRMFEDINGKKPFKPFTVEFKRFSDKHYLRLGTQLKKLLNQEKL